MYRTRLEAAGSAKNRVQNSGMQTLSQWPLEARRRITDVLTDIDDALTTDGAITVLFPCRADRVEDRRAARPRRHRPTDRLERIPRAGLAG